MPEEGEVSELLYWAGGSADTAISPSLSLATHLSYFISHIMSDQQSTEHASMVTVDRLKECGLICTKGTNTIYISTRGVKADGTKCSLTKSQAESLAHLCLMSLTDKALSGLGIPQAGSSSDRVQSNDPCLAHDIIQIATHNAMQNLQDLQNSTEEPCGSITLATQLLDRKIRIVDVTESHSFPEMRASNDPLTWSKLKELFTAPTSTDNRCVTLVKANMSPIKLSETDTGTLEVPSVFELAGGGHRYDPELCKELGKRLSERLNGTDEDLNHAQRMVAFFGNEATITRLQGQIRDSINQDLEALGITSGSMRGAEEYVSGEYRPFKVTSKHLRKSLTQDNVGDKCRLWARDQAVLSFSTEAEAECARSRVEAIIEHSLFSEKLKCLPLQDQEEALCNAADTLLFETLLEDPAGSSAEDAEITRINRILNTAETVKLQDMPKGLDFWEAKDFAAEEENYTLESDLKTATHLRLRMGNPQRREGPPQPFFVPIRSKNSFSTTDSPHSG